MSSRKASQVKKSSSKAVASVSKERTKNKPSGDEPVQNENTFSEQELEVLRNKTARYILMISSTGLPITRSDLFNVCFDPKHKKVYKVVLENAKTLIKQLTNCTLVPLDEKPLHISDKFFVKKLSDVPSFSGKTDVRDTLLTFILIAIQLQAEDKINEEEMKEFLEKLRINPNDCENSTFGNIPQHLQYFKAAAYLSYESEIGDENVREVIIKWGPRAKLEVSYFEMFKVLQKLFPGKPHVDILNSCGPEFVIAMEKECRKRATTFNEEFTALLKQLTRK